MARPIKKGLDYFSLDVNFYNDIKIRKIVRRKGGEALSVYTVLLCNIYEKGYYLEWSDDVPFLISEATGFEEDKVKSFILYCIEIGLFDKEMFDAHHVITSLSIQKRYSAICALTKRKFDPSSPYLLKSNASDDVSSEKMGVNSEETDDNSDKNGGNNVSDGINSGKSTQIKGNERKEKDIPPISPQGGMGDSPSGGSDLNDAGAAEEVPAAEVVSSNPVGYEKFDLSFVCDELREPFFRWLDYKRVDQRFKYKSMTSIKTCYNSLVKFSRSDPAKAMLIVEQSITNGWKGIFNSNMNNNGTGQQLTAQQRIDAELERGFEYAKGILARNDASIRDGVQTKVW